MTHLRRNLQIGVFACLAADLVLIGWLLSPLAPSQAANLEQLASAHAQLIGLRAQTARTRLLLSHVREGQLQIQALMAAGVPAEPTASSQFLAEFSRIAGLSQVQVSGAEFDPDKNARLGLRRVAIDMQVAGSYGGVVQFLNQLERSPMFFIINQVTVSGGAGAQAASGQVKLEVQLEAYVRA